MKTKLFLVLIFIITSFTFGQGNDNNVGKLNFLIGNWKGEGSGKPGEGEGDFSFKFDLNKNIIVRSSHSEYPAKKNKPLVIHDDLMIIYSNNSGNQYRAIYFDNEGHVINYSITFPDDNDIIFTSDKIPNVPLFKLTYTKINNDLINVKFEISPDGEKFSTYIEGRSKRQK